MNVVLPAPLPPMRPTTVSGSMLTLMSSAAVTAPKRLVRPSVCRIAAMSSAPAPATQERPQARWQEHDHEKHRDSQYHLPGVRRVLICDALDPFEQQRTGKWRRDIRGAAQDRDKHKFAGRRPVREVGIDMADRQRDEAATDAGQHGGNHIVQMHDAPHRSAHVFDTEFVVSDRRPESPAMRPKVSETTNSVSN